MKAICTYWRERRIERGGHRIIPTLNVSYFDHALYSQLTLQPSISHWYTKILILVLVTCLSISQKSKLTDHSVSM